MSGYYTHFIENQYNMTKYFDLSRVEAFSHCLHEVIMKDIIHILNITKHSGRI